MRLASSLLVLALSASLSTPALGAAPAWTGVGDEEEVTIIVQQEDETQREVTIWLVVVDDQGYIRTRNTRWRAHLERDPNATLRIRDKEYTIRVSPVMNEALQDQIHRTYTEKYGRTSDIFLSLMRPFLGAYNVYRVDGR